MRRIPAALSLALALPLASYATLTNSYQFNGKGNWSIDAVGSNSTPVGVVQAFIPTGATVERAFLYSSISNLGGSIGSIVPSVNFDGTTYSGAQWTDLGGYNPQAASFPNFYLQAYRTDVTAQVAAKAAGGSATPFDFTVQSESPTGNIDGEVLAIVYSLPTEATRTIAFLDGFSTSAGDSTAINLADPLTAGQLSDPAFSAQLSLGIGFSAGGSQFSNVDVNGTRLTSSAGGFDDGVLSNGALITAGGLGDDPSNPANPASTSSPDDELYDLVPFLSAGDTVIDIDTQNPSLDDNIFFAAINITAVAGVNQPPPDVEPPPTGVPDGGTTVMLLGSALLALAAVKRRWAR